MHSSILIVCLTGWAVVSVTGYPGGAPTGACISQTPSHQGTATQPTTPPYQIRLDASTLERDRQVTVTLEATGQNGYFKGFLLQARCVSCANSDTTIIPGTFAVSGVDAQTLNCNGQQNAVTHRSRSMKSRATFTWTPPTNLNLAEGVQFRATVVQDFTVWWANVQSTPLTAPTGTGTTPSQTATTAASRTTAAPSVQTTQQTGTGASNVQLFSPILVILMVVSGKVLA